MFTFATDYYLFVSVAALGVIQIGASLGHLRGLVVVKSPLAARIIGLMLTVMAFVWFFVSDTRNLNDYEGGLDAPTQALFFFLGTLTAVVATVLGSAVLNARMNDSKPMPTEGLDALKHTHYIRALAHSFRYWWREWRTQTRPYFFG